MSDEMPPIAPCPFCGGGETSTDERWTSPEMSGKRSLEKVWIRHWCDIQDARPAQRLYVEVHGRNHADAAAAWNMRAGEAKP